MPNRVRLHKSHPATTNNKITPATGTTPSSVAVSRFMINPATSPPGAARTSSAIPWHTIMVPSVQASDCKPRYATNAPSITPTSSPIKQTRIKLRSTPPAEVVLTVATRTLASAITPTDERSSSPVNMTNVKPAEERARTIVLLSKSVIPAKVMAEGAYAQYT